MKGMNLKEELNCYIFEFEHLHYMYDYYNGIIIQLTDKTYSELKQIINNESLCIEQYPYVQQLINCGMIYGKRNELINNKESSTAYLSFAPIYQCNFRCSYCFGEYGYKYKGKIRQYNDETIIDMLNYFFFTAYPNYQQYRIDFVSGGEPLLKFNLIQHLIEYVELIKIRYKKNITIWLCTNGSLLSDEICEYLSKHNISIGVSLDGCKEVNDKNRIDANGNGTYDLVVNNIKNIFQNRNLSNKFKELWGLCVASNENCDFIDILKLYNEIGIKNAQIRLVRNEEKYDVEKIIQKYKELSEFMLESFIQKKWQYIYMILNDNDQFGKILKRILLNQIVIKRCGVGKNKMTICPDGSIYPCDSFVGIDEFNLGNINSLNKVYHSIENCEVYKRNICNKCEVNLLCGGDCFYHSFINCNSIYPPEISFCKIQKYIIKTSIVLRYKMEKYDSKSVQELIKKVKIKDEYRNAIG